MGNSGSATFQGSLWGAAADDWAEIQEPTGAPLWTAMLEAGNVDQGTRLLDAGCGAGGASVLAAKRGAQVSGVDASSALLDIARRRVPTGDFRMADLEDLPFGRGAFEVAMAANSVQYAADPMAALGELHRVLAPGAKVLIGTWGEAQDCEMAAVFRSIIDLLPALPPDDPFALAEPGALERLIKQSGFLPEAVADVQCPFEYPDVETGWHGLRSSGPVQGAIRAVGEDRVRAAVIRALEPFRENSTVRVMNTFRYVVGRT